MAISLTYDGSNHFIGISGGIDSGTATGGDTFSLIDSSKSLSSNVYKYRTIVITGGTGAGQIRSISGNTSTTIYVATLFDITPSTDSTYIISYDIPDLYAADQAGTFDLLSATPTTNMTLDYQVRPSDENDIQLDFILASSGAGSGDTIDITGTTAGGGTITETIDVSSGDGTYTTTKYYATITDIDCNGFSSGTLTVRQNKWGVIKKNGLNYTLDGIRIELSISSVEGYLSIYSYYQVDILEFDNKIDDEAYFLGDSSSNLGYLFIGKINNFSYKYTTSGCTLIFNNVVNTGIPHYVFKNLNNIVIVSSILSSSGSGIKLLNFTGIEGYFYNSSLKDIMLSGNAGNDLYVYNLYINGIYDFLFDGSCSNFERINYTGSGNIINFYTVTSIDPIRLVDITSYSTGSFIYLSTSSNLSYSITFVDCNFLDLTWDKYLYGKAAYSRTCERRYSYILNITDKDNDPIETARIFMIDNEDTIFTNETSTSTGYLSSTLEVLMQYWDLTSDGYQPKIIVNPYTIKIRKYGYLFKEFIKSFTVKTINTEILQDNNIVSANESTAGAYTGISVNGSAKTITISSNHTLQEIYDYTQYWAVQSGNIQYEEPITSIDGINFTMAEDWDLIVNTGITVTATDKNLNFSGTGTWTLTGTGAFLGIMIDATTSRVPITLTSVITGSRILIEKTSDSTEIHNAVLTGTELTIYYEETSATGVTITIRNASGSTKYKSYGTTGTVSLTTGFSAVVSQELDG